jgi:multidrug efflux system membrane fusion protein
MKRLPLLGSLALGAALIAAGCAGGDTPPRSGRAGNGGNADIPVTTAEVVQKTMPLTITVIGSAEAYSNVAVHPQITGELTSVDFKEGDDIHKGDIIFTLDFRPLESALEQAEAALARDTAQADNARASAARYDDLQSRGIAPLEQADQARTSAAARDATVLADRAAVENAKVQLRYATIFAPLTGRTGALMVHPGNLVRANDTTPLVVINQISPIYVSFGIPEGQLPDLKRYLAAGSVAVEAAAPGVATPSKGHITFIDNAVDPTTGQIKVKASFPNDDRQLWPGQFVHVTVTLKLDQRAIVVPTGAVQEGTDGRYVFVLKPDRTVDMRSVAVDREIEDATVVQSGLAQGDIVVTDGQDRLSTGSKVTVKSGPGHVSPQSAKANP